MICPRCGTDNMEGARTCAACGLSLSAQDAGNVKPAVRTETEARPKRMASRAGRRFLALPGAAALVVSVAGIVLASLVTSWSSSVNGVRTAAIIEIVLHAAALALVLIAAVRGVKEMKAGGESLVRQSAFWLMLLIVIYIAGITAVTYESFCILRSVRSQLDWDGVQQLYDICAAFNKYMPWLHAGGIAGAAALGYSFAGGRQQRPQSKHNKRD